jgi:hypothetical protein
MIEFEPVNLMDPKIYFSQGARHFSPELIKLYQKARGKDHGNNDETLCLTYPRSGL